MTPKIHTKWLGYMASAALFAASLTSCNRAEYAMLPKTSSYHGTASTRAIAVAPVAPEAAPVAAPAVAPATEASAPQATPAVATKPAATAVEVAAVSKPAAAPAKAEVAAKPAKAPKMNLVQKAMVQKVMKKADKLASKAQFKQKSEVADANRLSGKLRQGLILILASLLVALLASIGGTIGTLLGIIASILFLVGVVLIILYLLDEV